MQSGSVVEGSVCCVCGKSESRPWHRAPDNLLGTAEVYSSVRCSHCGTARLYPRLSPEQLSRHYTPLTYARAEGSAGDSELGKRLDAIFERQADQAIQFLDARKPGRMLDVGCGDGRFLSVMAARGWRDGTGIETDTAAANLARLRTGANILATPLETADIESASFDFVSFLHVLEHVPDPSTVLAAARAALKPGGALLIAVPNVASLEARIFGANWYHLDLPRHLWGFTPNSLRQIVEESGFHVQTIRYLPFLFALQSLRNIARKLRPRPSRKNVNNMAAQKPEPRSDSGWQTALFLRMLAASEKWGRVHGGEIMEMYAIALPENTA